MAQSTSVPLLPAGTEAVVAAPEGAVGPSVQVSVLNQSAVIGEYADYINFSSFALARESYKITDLQSLRVYVVAPGGQTDPLQQSRKLGYKFSFKTAIVNQTWIRRVRSSGANATNNA